MTEWKEYKRLEIPGHFLLPGFSIYLFEIDREIPKDKWFYVGMTGDIFYPSARAAFHRLSGHLELSNHSTQNQLKLALEELGVTHADYPKLKITMHHFPIEGFEDLNLPDKKAETVKKHKETLGYKNYVIRQREVMKLENVLIHKLQGKILNKTDGKKCETTEIPYREIYNTILKLVNK